MPPVTIRVARDAEDLSRIAAQFVAAAAAEAVAARGSFVMALSGGRTPRGLYALLAEPPLVDQVPWAAVHLFWGDERCVPLDHPDSNYRMAREALLDRAPVPPEHVHRAPTERGGPHEVAAAYERDLRRFFLLADRDLPRFDLVLLGMGAEGHTASLFPGSPALEERRKLVAPVPDQVPPRVTLTLPVINAARTVAFLVSGGDKVKAMQDALSGDAVPAGRVQPKRGEVIWFADEAAMGRRSPPESQRSEARRETQ